MIGEIINLCNNQVIFLRLFIQIVLFVVFCGWQYLMTMHVRHNC